MISTDCRKCAKSDFCYVDDVKPCIGYEPKKLTNADRIRTMTDEELANLFDDIETKAYMSEYRGVLDWLEWLKQEATDEHP